MTWGRYDEWKPVRYIFSYKPNCRPIEAKCALPLLLEHIDPRPEKVYIFVVDTVLPSTVDSYDELIENVRSYYLSFVEELGVNKDLIEIVVCPGIGEFKIRNGWVKVFRGSLGDYYFYAFYEICKALSRFGEGDLKISLDFTHGVNYMPVLTYRALKEALEIAALSRDVEFTVYNSEPYSKDVKELRVHLVESRKVPVGIVPEGLPAGKCRLLSRYEDIKSEEAESLGKRLDETVLETDLVRELNAFLGSIVNGLPLVLLTFYPDCDALEDKINKALQVWKSEIEIKRDGKRLLVLRKASLNENFARLLRIWLAAKILKLSKSSEASLEELHELRERIYSKWENLNSMISRDLETIEEDVRRNLGVLIDRWERLKNLRGGGDWNERNFLAHSGLERKCSRNHLEN